MRTPVYGYTVEQKQEEIVTRIAVAATIHSAGKSSEERPLRFVSRVRISDSRSGKAGSAARCLTLTDASDEAVEACAFKSSICFEIPSIWFFTFVLNSSCDAFS